MRIAPPGCFVPCPRRRKHMPWMWGCRWWAWHRRPPSVDVGKPDAYVVTLSDNGAENVAMYAVTLPAVGGHGEAGHNPLPLSTMLLTVPVALPPPPFSPHLSHRRQTRVLDTRRLRSIWISRIEERSACTFFPSIWRCVLFERKGRRCARGVAEGYFGREKCLWSNTHHKLEYS